MGLLRVLRWCLGFALFAFGGLMTLACFAGMPAHFQRDEPLVVLIGGEIIAIAAVATVGWIGWYLMRPPASESAVTDSMPMQPASEITVVVQNPTPPAPLRHVVHRRCHRCGNTTPESEQHCGQCGAVLK